MDEAGVLDFLTSLEAMDLPDRIEEVNSKILSKIIEDSDYVAVLFCKLARCQCMTPQPDALYVFFKAVSLTICVQLGHHFLHQFCHYLMYSTVDLLFFLSVTLESPNHG